MDRGRVAQVGTPAELYERPATPFIASFIGDANLIESQVVKGRFTVPGMTLDVPGRDGPATLSIRPERIRLTPGGPDLVMTATYLGSRMEYLIEAQVGEMLVLRPIFKPQLAEGQDVSLHIAAVDISRVA